MVKLDPLATSTEPREMVISSTNPQSSSRNLKLTDILVGEVWLGSGQSNMAGGSATFETRDAGLSNNLAAAPYPALRVISSSATGWQEGTKENLRRFSALQFSLGITLHKQLGVPVGLLAGSVGGTPSGNWLSAEAFASSPAIKDAIAHAPAFNLDAAMKKYAQDLAKWEKLEADAKQKGEKPRGRAPLKPVKVGECDRGTVGCLYEKHIRAFIPYAIRGVLWDQGESGTAIQGVDQFTVMGALFAGWRKEWGQGDFPFLSVEKPSGLGCGWDVKDPVTCNANEFKPLPATVPGMGGGREQFIRMIRHPNAFMVTASDLGGSTHPTNKSGYGVRAARVALGLSSASRTSAKASPSAAAKSCKVSPWPERIRSLSGPMPPSRATPSSFPAHRSASHRSSAMPGPPTRRGPTCSTRTASPRCPSAPTKNKKSVRHDFVEAQTAV
ncbi:MAG: hypothetical protein NTY53_17275, partial [Kiritimatiellaeota bacterium]|nr:hypothetical protein [Kiritimatiellota bacterium]